MQGLGEVEAHFTGNMEDVEAHFIEVLNESRQYQIVHRLLSFSLPKFLSSSLDSWRQMIVGDGEGSGSRTLENFSLLPRPRMFRDSMVSMLWNSDHRSKV